MDRFTTRCLTIHDTEKGAMAMLMEEKVVYMVVMLRRCAAVRRKKACARVLDELCRKAEQTH